MRAAVMDGPYRMRVGEVGTPRPEAQEVLISVGAAGICAGDLHIYHGRNPYATFPQICGHEIAGVVAEVGDAVKDFDPGTSVVVEPFLGCGKCYPCRVNKPNCCVKLTILGVNREGGYAEFLRAPASHVHRIPASLSHTQASFTEPVAIALQACRRGEVAAGDEVLILGCGPIGLALIEVARHRGARVIATDILPQRLEIAAQFGAEVFLADDKLPAKIFDCTDGEGAHVVIEATGSVNALEQAIDLVASGGRVVVVGLMKAGVKASFPALDLTRKEMTVVGSRASVNCFPESIQLLASGAVLYPRVASEYSMWDAPAVFAHLAENPTEVNKAVLVV
ncbi:MAG: zinc-binding alcohol dehydrogenase family protein [Pyrinomonadaceae bacterium]